MKEFILLSLKGRTSPDFSLSDLVDSGRLDIASNFIGSCLSVCKDLRRDTVAHIALSGPKNPPKLVSVYGKSLKGFLGDERSASEIIKNALKKGKNLVLNQTIGVQPGVTVSKKSLETLMKEKSDQGYQIIYLHKRGTDIKKFKFQKKFLAVIGDHIGLPRNTERLLKSIGAKKLSLGPKMLYAAHCPTIINNELDRL